MNCVGTRATDRADETLAVFIKAVVVEVAASKACLRADVMVLRVSPRRLTSDAEPQSGKALPS